MATQFKKVTITRDDFETANYGSNTDCAIARALKRAGLDKVMVGGYDYAYYANGKKFNVYHTRKLDAVLDAWRFMGKYPNSFSFQVPVA